MYNIYTIMQSVLLFLIMIGTTIFAGLFLTALINNISYIIDRKREKRRNKNVL